MIAKKSERPSLPVLDAKQATFWDESARLGGSPSRVLMESAGRAAAYVVSQRYPDLSTRGTIVAVGHGNNGGDGWVFARALHAVGARVWVAEYEKQRSADCEANRALAIRDGVPVLGEDEKWPRAELVVDSLLGTGASGKPKGAVGNLAARLMELDVPVVAIDGPTGLDLTTGVANGPVRADLTVTFGGLRRGHLLARDWCGRLIVLDIGFGLCPKKTDWPSFVDDGWCGTVLPKFESAMHKGGRGRVAVIGGEDGMAGAVQYAARAAFAAGAGLVRVAAHEKTTAAVQENFPDVTTTTTQLGNKLEPDVVDLITWADAIVLGPGLGRDAERTLFVKNVLESAQCPVVLDADALHVGTDVLKRGATSRVLTPHMGEFKTAFPRIEDTDIDRFRAVAKAAGNFEANTAVLLKGVPTVIASGTDVRVVAAGNPGLATGGSGDVLSGLIGAFLARDLTPVDAASLGAQALGKSAELVAQDQTVRAMRPDNVIGMFPEVWKTWQVSPIAQSPVLLDLPAPSIA